MQAKQRLYLSEESEMDLLAQEGMDDLDDDLYDTDYYDDDDE